MSALAELEVELARANDLDRAAAVLSWDLETQMPPGGLEARAGQLATLRRLAHDIGTSARVGRLLELAEAETQSLPFDSDEASLVRVARRDYQDSLRIPADLVAEMAAAGARARPVWEAARAASDWSMFEPSMRTTLDLARRFAEAAGYAEEPYDALIHDGEPGLTTAEVLALFDDMKRAIVPLVRRIAARADLIDDSCLHGDFDPEQQLRFGHDLVAQLGFDFGAGRQDLSAHPFCTSFGPGDVRITTRVSRGHLAGSLFGIVHESGHGMYDQGIPATLDRGTLWAGASPGVHESQSRLWENLIGRSRPFWVHFGGRLQASFPQLGGVDAEQLYRAVNRVQPSYIRVEADEVTYNLHIVLRTELERDLLAGRLRVEEVPEAWNAALDEYLGLPPASAAEGPLQDIHWTHPTLGGFVGYSIGNAIGAQLMEQVRVDLPDLDRQVESGSFEGLLGWLRDHVYAHGRKFTPQELVLRATGRALSAQPWVDHLTAKFGELYGL